MAYTDDAVKAKLSALNETQESIVTVAQWVMFHRRHADRTAQIWLQRIRDSTPPKRLNLIYLANEVAQQSKARGKDDFLIAFAPIVVEATALAYTSSTKDIKQKIRRVVEVWRQRNVFEAPIISAVESRINGRSYVQIIRATQSMIVDHIPEIDETQSSTKTKTLGGSFFKDSSTGSAPTELQPLTSLQTALTKAAISSNTLVATANTDYKRLNDSKAEKPTPPVHAARLGQLFKTLANAESSVSESIKSRRALIEALEKLLATNRSSLLTEVSLAGDLAEKKLQTDAKKREVEDAIMRSLPTDNGSANTGEVEFSRPQAEALTPPPVEALTPVGSPQRDIEETSGSFGGPFLEESSHVPRGLVITGNTHPDNGTEFPDLSNISPVGGSDFDFGLIGSGSKRRKVAHEEDGYEPGQLEADVEALIKEESQNQ
ncbi:hypothetical protein N7495_004505 [Penicillium taxi]|uniref:uncharacterized protein n=1 Tax=Penicillium taxi TaxID=168475 RepID=UPI00254595E1|nr:uncharacterized protein N7495_004505 [Penicillium taxi]KAJ5899761.1 hypothetical protein N7495_004505 [Penicillium taxi]